MPGNQNNKINHSDRIVFRIVFRTGDFAGLVTLREWTRVSGLVDAEQLRCKVQLVEEKQAKENMGRSDKDGFERKKN